MAIGAFDLQKIVVIIIIIILIIIIIIIIKSKKIRHQAATGATSAIPSKKKPGKNLN
jgi:preprotein translocase subunit SecG